MSCPHEYIFVQGCIVILFVHFVLYVNGWRRDLNFVRNEKHLHLIPQDSIESSGGRILAQKQLWKFSTEQLLSFDMGSLLLCFDLRMAWTLWVLFAILQHDTRVLELYLTGSFYFPADAFWLNMDSESAYCLKCRAGGFIGWSWSGNCHRWEHTCANVWAPNGLCCGSWSHHCCELSTFISGAWLY